MLDSKKIKMQNLLPFKSSGLCPPINPKRSSSRWNTTICTYLTHRLYNPEMTTEQLVHLAVYVISETATQDPRVGGPIRVADITWEKGYVELEESYIDEVNRRNEEAHERLRQFFLGKKEEKQ